MRTSIKKSALCLALIAAMLITGLCHTSTASADNAGVTKLTTGKTYKSWDIDGDGSKDRLVIKRPNEHDAKVYVNGKCKYTFKGGYGGSDSYDLAMVSLESGKNLLFMRVMGDNADGPGRLIDWSEEKNKLVNIFNISNAAVVADYGFHIYVEPISVSKDTVKISFFNYNYLVGGVEFSFDYRYVDGKMKRVSNYGKIIEMHKMTNGEVVKTNSLVAARKINVYKKPGSGKSTNLQQTIKKGKRVKFTGIWTNGNQLWMRVTVNGKKGYIKCYKEDNPKSKITYFKNLWFAG